MSIKHPKQSLERGFLPTDGKWTLMNIDFPTQNSHRSCLSAVKRARYPLKDERRPDQGAGSCRAWHFFFWQEEEVIQNHGIYVLLCQSEKHVCIWSGGWISFQCLHQQHPRSQRRPWYFRGAFSLVERWQVGRSTCGLRTTTSAMCANLSTGTGKWSRLEQIARCKPLVMSNGLNLVCAVTKRSQQRDAQWTRRQFRRRSTVDWFNSSPSSGVPKSRKTQLGSSTSDTQEVRKALNSTRVSSSFPCSVALNI